MEYLIQNAFLFTRGGPYQFMRYDKIDNSGQNAVFCEMIAHTSGYNPMQYKHIRNRKISKRYRFWKEECIFHVICELLRHGGNDIVFDSSTKRARFPDENELRLWKMKIYAMEGREE